MSTPAAKGEESFPFEIVVVTFPDEGAARVASEGPLHVLKEVYPQTTFLSTCDPLGCRCGSGGGTLAALAEVELLCGKYPEDKNILILHAGGDSSRCFTQMALGKAWTNLPLRSEETGKTVWSNPIQLGMDSIARLFSKSHRLPSGSIVIAASDALLSIPHYKPEELQTDFMSNEDIFQSDVLGVAFPAPWEIAKNHGVYVLADPSSSSQSTRAAADAKALEVPIRKVLQKPSLEVLQKEPFSNIGIVPNDINDLAWIDNGIIAFLPKSAQALQKLSRGILATTTKTGLVKAYQERKHNESNLTYQEVTHKVDLYTHFLQALTIQGEPGEDTSEARHREVYMRDHASDLQESVAAGIFETLSPFSFQALAIPEGKFLHLGTTRELKDFYVYGCMRLDTLQHFESPSANPTRYELYTRNCTFFGRELGMVRRLDLYADFQKGSSQQSSSSIGKNCVLMGSVLSAASSSFIDDSTVLEFCCIEGSSTGCPSIQIGKNCLVSGLRDLKGSSQPVASPLRIPDNTSIQMMPLMKDKNDTNNDPLFVYMALGIDDPIKKLIDESTFLGFEMQSFLKWTGLTQCDIWDESSSNTLWNAKLHPVVTESSGLSFSGVWGWMNYLPTNDIGKSLPDEAQESLKRWKSQPRLSLSQVRDQSDAAEEFRHRQWLIHSLIPARRKGHCQQVMDILCQRRNDECDFHTLLSETLCMDEYDTDSGHLSSQATQALEALDEVVQKSLLQRSQDDICGRTSMVASALLGDLSDTCFVEVNTPEDGNASLVDDIQQRCSILLKTIGSQNSSGVDRQHAYNQLCSVRDEYFSSANGSSAHLRAVLGKFSVVMESIARTMTEICVSGCLHDNSAISNRTYTRKQSVIGQWVISTAPARIDLSGGWSDTPPVCYEYGSAVTGVAVTVDRNKPLSCRCRIVHCGAPSQEQSDNGIILMRSELRDSNTCQLTSSLDIKLQNLDDLRDARDPSAPCALIKCALICLGLLSISDLDEHASHDAKGNNLQSYVNEFCQIEKGENARLEIVITSLLPQGSGMGTSSILGGCVLAAVGNCVGIEHSDLSVVRDKNDPIDAASGSSDIIDSVSTLEQILSTGGGFQDQVNGLIGGFKMVSCEARQLPIHLTIESLQIDPSFRKSLDERLMLVFTGKTRLAKNILQNVLRRWARRTPEVVETVQKLVEGAHKAKEALQKGDLETLGECFDAYYSQKKHMAGENSGVEPETVKNILLRLKHEELICGAAFCGAGGGGFLAMIATPGVDKDKIHTLVEQAANEAKHSGVEHSAFTWHECHISDEGLVTRILPKLGLVNEPISYFDKSWHHATADQFARTE